jgi:hypothetical protein
MGEVRNCKRCGKVFLYAGVPICPECLAKEDEQFRKVNRYIDSHQGAGVEETSDETGVPVDIVVEFLRQGLLVTGSGANAQLTCMVCKKPITRGRLCPKCEAALGAGTGKLARSLEGARMYTMESIGKKN